MKEAKGKALLKVTGILMIIGGIASIIMTIIPLIGGGAILAEGQAAGLDESTAIAVTGVLLIASIVMIAAGVIELIAGVLGVIKSKTPNSAKPCMVFGIIIIVLSLVSSVMNIISGGITATSAISAVTGLIIPVLYTIGAYQNMHS